MCGVIFVACNDFHTKGRSGLTAPPVYFSALYLYNLISQCVVVTEHSKGSRVVMLTSSKMLLVIESRKFRKSSERKNMEKF